MKYALFLNVKLQSNGLNANDCA